ncbi:MAG: transcriptional repressor [Phycisphaerae bacterium]|nr:transcriptional repressor [Phycisphaerae bacterium]
MRRDTSQRRAILGAFEKAARPLSPQEVLQSAQCHVPAIGMATVYRNIKRLIEEAVLEAVQLPGEPPRYELAGKHHHHHFHCRVCGRLYEVDGCLAAFRKLTPKGFKLEGHDLLLFGQCARCIPRKRPAK